MEAIRIYAAGPERLAIDVVVTGSADPTLLTVETCMSLTSSDEEDAAPSTGWQGASWRGPNTIITHLITGLTAGTYGLWWRLTRADEKYIVFAGPIPVS